MADNSLLIEDIVGTRAFDQLEALELNLEVIDEKIAALVKGFNTLGRSVEQANDIKSLAAAQQQLSKAQAESVRIVRQQVEVRAQVRQITVAQVDAETSLTAALSKTATSIKEAREQNKLLTRARNETNVATQEGVARLNELNAKIDANNKFIKDNGDQALRQKLNIGNYASALSGLGGVFGSVIGQAKGLLSLLKSLPPSVAPFAGAITAAAAGLKLWATTTAQGEEAAIRLRTELDTMKENFKNNIGFELGNLIKDNDTFFNATADGLDAINELAQKTDKSFSDWIKMALIGAFSAEGAYQEYAKSQQKALTLEEELKEAIKRNATTNEEYRERVKQFSKDTYDFERKRITSLTEVAALERDIALLQETARDATKSVEERLAARTAALEKINELEAIQLGMAKEQVRLIQEETELTHTAQYDTLRGIDEILGKRQEEAALLRMMASHTDSLEDTEKKREHLTARRLELEEQLTRAVGERVTLQDDLATEAEQAIIKQADLRVSTLQGQLSAVKEQEGAVLKVVEASERLKQVEVDLEKLTALRQEGSKDILANEEKAATAAVGELKTQEQFANMRRSLSRLGQSLTNEELADRKAALKEYTDALKSELDNQVAAAKAAADEAQAIYRARGNDGLNQEADAREWLRLRVEALEAQQRAEEELVRKTAEKTIEIYGYTGDEARNIAEKTEEVITLIAEKYGIRRQTLAADNARQAAAAVAAQIKAENDRLTADIDAQLDQRNIDLLRSLEAGEISYRQYNKSIGEAQMEALRQQLKAQMDYYDRIMEAEGVSLAERQAALAKYADLYSRYLDASAQASGNAWDTMDWGDKLNRIVDLAKEAWGAIADAVKTSIDNQIADLDNQQKHIDENYNKQLEQVKNMGLTQRQQELETARIEKEHAAETERIEAEKAALQTRQAKWDKANSIVQATIAGALAIVQAFAQAGPVAGAVFAGIIGAITAVQIATIAAQKIPEYRTGRTGGREEVAIVGDGGVAEVIETPAGHAFITPDKPTLTRLGRGDRVWRNVEEYLVSRKGDPAVVGELRAMRKDSRRDSARLGDIMQSMNARLSVTSAGLAWLRNNNNTGAYANN